MGEEVKPGEGTAARTERLTPAAAKQAVAQLSGTPQVEVLGFGIFGVYESCAAADARSISSLYYTRGHQMKIIEETRDKSSVGRLPLIIGLSMTILVFFLPFGYRLDIGPGPDSIRALIWEYIEAPWHSGFWFVQVGIFLTSLLYTFPRFIFLYQMIRYYSCKIPRKSVIRIGIVSELFPALVSILLIIGWQLGWTQPPPPFSDPWFPIYIPIPALLIIGLGLVLIIPPVQLKADDEPEQNYPNKEAN